jgi:hypothetical protein
VGCSELFSDGPAGDSKDCSSAGLEFSTGRRTNPSDEVAAQLKALATQAEQALRTTLLFSRTTTMSSAARREKQQGQGTKTPLGEGGVAVSFAGSDIVVPFRNFDAVGSGLWAGFETVLVGPSELCPHRRVGLGPDLGVGERPTLAGIVKEDNPEKVVLLAIVDDKVGEPFTLGGYDWNGRV